jgi:regulatory protein
MAQNSCMEYALSYLSRYPKTEQEMRILLYKKGYTSEQITSTMESLKKNNFINDEKYTESYLYSEIVKKGKPVFLIKQKLQQRGIDKRLIDELIEGMKDDMGEGIAKEIRKQLDTYKAKGVDGFDSIQKLMRKGYRLQDIKAVIQPTNE